ncbi:MAG: M20 family metallo-hydrolase [Microscillaceae bacterium]|nr:M20 family metallo-hydrolase [Microscillaceae bacterium]
MTNYQHMQDQVVQLLKKLIAIPSLSKEEHQSADLLFEFIQEKGLQPERNKNNVWIRSSDFVPERPTILLNSHHDTIKPNAQWSFDPFKATEQEGKIYGLGANDAGASLVALLATFFILNESPRNFNLIWAGTAEEEISGEHGIALILPELGKIDVAIVGEPTQMQMAVAEKGLMVLDGLAKGKAGHAARDEGINAIYEVISDLEWFQSYEFPRESELLGRVKMTVTQIQAGYQHNVVPDHCSFVVDVRSNELYTNEQIFEIIQKSTRSEMKARSFRLNSSAISLEHPLVQKGKSLGISTFGSPTLSDQALMSFPTLKIGPGESMRSHTADEYVHVSEIYEGIHVYCDLLKDLNLNT